METFIINNKNSCNFTRTESKHIDLNWDMARNTQSWDGKAKMWAPTIKSFRWLFISADFMDMLVKTYQVKIKTNGISSLLLDLLRKTFGNAIVKWSKYILWTPKGMNQIFYDL